MGFFLNSKGPCADYREMISDSYFVDKSMLIKELLPALGKKNRFFCITRPRRFGKSVMANMVGAFFGKSVDSSELFDFLAIAKHKKYKEHLNQHNVIYIDFSRMPENCNSYQAYISRIQSGLKEDLILEYPELPLDPAKAVWDNLQMIFEKNGQKFIFVIDEWDAIFHKSFIKEEDKERYLEFLRNLLKGQIYVELAYMTGVLPIAKYSSGSELNMFLEYDMATRKKFSEYFGFLDAEVDELFEIYKHETENPEISRADLRIWYDGYCTATGKRLYNPRSVVCALTDNELSNYWTSSGPYDEIFYYIRNNIKDVRNDLVLMSAGEHIKMMLQGYAAMETELETKNQIYSAMVVYGLLTYEYGAVFIPNKELMDKYNELLLTNDRLGYIHRLAKDSDKMLSATLAGDTETMAEILKFAHDTETPILSYNSEIELAAVVNLVYLSARDRYRVEREDKAGEGFVDFIFYPERRNDIGIILELKVDSTPEEALRQIRNKNYILRFRGKLGEMPKYSGKILAVGISYDRKTKAHTCKIEVLREPL
ncbi:hypothetical protein D3Z62_21900 [Lachnospiraceae bacterium]|nr:hypothetical protein [Lachnospiraceae bacterium]